jgi:DNA-binding FadR family transcriptional regulator
MKNAHGMALDRLGCAIVAGRWAPGATVPPEPTLCLELGVSRTVVREAVKSLVAKGLLSTGPKVGTRVLAAEQWNWFDPDVVAWQSRAGLTPEFLAEVQELRALIEPAAARLAAARATALDVVALQSAYQGMRGAVAEGGDYVQHDLAFHAALLKASHNRLLVQMSKALSALLRTAFEIATARPQLAAASLPLHRAMLDAVIARSPVRAERATRRLINSAREDIAAVLAANKMQKPPTPSRRRKGPPP